MKPTQDINLKKYLARTIKHDMDKIFNHVDYQFYDKKEMKEFFNKCATNIQRQLNEMGYVQMPVDKPAIADEPPTYYSCEPDSLPEKLPEPQLLRGKTNIKQGENVMKQSYIEPQIAQGYKRSYMKCKECGRPYFYDYIPYSLSSPIITTDCGHSVGAHDYNLKDISQKEWLRLMNKKEEKI